MKTDNKPGGWFKLRNVRVFAIPFIITFVIMLEAIVFTNISHFSKINIKVDSYIEYRDLLRNYLEVLEKEIEYARYYAKEEQESYLKSYEKEWNTLLELQNNIEAYEGFDEDSELAQLRKNMLDDASDLLYKTNYALRLLADSKHISKERMIPSIREIKIKEESVLSDAEKLKSGRDLLNSTDYNKINNRILSNLNSCCEILIDQTRLYQDNSINIFSKLFLNINIGVVILFVIAFSLFILLQRYVIHPIKKFSSNLAKGSSISLEGPEEITLLAQSYNQIMESDLETQRLMRHETQHDELTNTLDTDTYDRLINIYKRGDVSYAIIMIEIDYFDYIIEKYGEEKGREVIKEVANTLLRNFRRADYVCRLTEYSFAVIAVNTNSTNEKIIRKKFTNISEQLKNNSINGPKITISMGIAFSDRSFPGESVCKFAEDALIYVQENGGDDCAVF